MSDVTYFPENLSGFPREEFDLQNAKPAGLYERERNVALGEPIDIAYLSTDYTGSGSLVWDVRPGQVQTAAYSLSGMQMTLALYLVAFSVSGTGNNLRFKIPGGYKAARNMGMEAFVNDNGTRTTGLAGVVADSEFLSISRTDAANYAASTANSTVIATLTFWVKSQAV